MFEKKLYNSKIVDIYIKYITKYYPDLDTGSLLKAAKMKMYEINDPGHWFTQEQVDLFYSKACELTGNNNLAREAGRFAASSDALGTIKYWTLGLLSPASVFRMIYRAASLLTRSTNYEAHKLGATKYEVIVEPLPGIQEKPYQCENRLGFFEAIVRLFGYTNYQIKHPECMFNGSDTCRYIISWRQSFSSIYSKIINSLILLFLFCLPFFFWTSHQIPFWYIFIFLTCIIFLKSLALLQENKELLSNIVAIQYSSEQLIQQTNINYQNALLTYDIGAAVTSQTSTPYLLNKAIELLQERLDYDRGLIMLANEDKSRLEFREGFGYTQDELALLEQSSFNLSKKESRGVFVLSFNKQKPFLVNDLQEIENDLSQHSLELAKSLNTSSFICCPILFENESLGILAVDNKTSKRPLVQRDMSFLQGIVHFIGVSLNNTTLLQTKENQFKSLIRTLTASVDARDPWTAGHSENVTDYAIGICHELELPQETQEMIYVAALLHDYGKIAIPDAILKKKGKLTEEEYRQVQLHADKTRNILQQIHFEGEYIKLPDIAAAHHEYLDGTGYPQGLKEDQIPYESQIIAVADFFEAVTAKRPYRDPIPLHTALIMLDERKGNKFQPEIVDALKAYLKRSSERGLPDVAY